MMTQEERFALVDAVTAAKQRGDFVEVNRLKSLLPLSDGLAKCALQHFGVEGLEKAKSMGLNFSGVEERYGNQWYKHV